MYVCVSLGGRIDRVLGVFNGEGEKWEIDNNTCLSILLFDHVYIEMFSKRFMKNYFCFPLLLLVMFKLKYLCTVHPVLL